MFAQRVGQFYRRSSIPTFGRASFSASPIGSFASTLQSNVWRKSNILYITYIVVGCVAIELVYGKTIDLIWEKNNDG
eukprot:gene1145-1601_t